MQFPRILVALMFSSSLLCIENREHAAQHDIVIPAALYQAMEILNVEKFTSALQQSGPLCKQAKKLLHDSLSLTMFHVQHTESAIDMQKYPPAHALVLSTGTALATTIAAFICMTMSERPKKQLAIVASLSGLYTLYGLLEAHNIDTAERTRREQQKIVFQKIQTRIVLLLQMLEQHPQSDRECA